MLVSVIAAMGANGVIGDDKGLPWHLPADLKRFKNLTLGKPVIMGRRTADLIGKPLPGRFNIVLTRNRKYPLADGRFVAHSLVDALSAAREYLAREGGEEVMVIGGGEVYQEFVRFCDKVYLTVVLGRFSGNAFFPTCFLSGHGWQVIDWQIMEPDEKNRHPHFFYVMERNRENALTALSADEMGVDRIPATTLLEVLDFLAEDTRSLDDSQHIPRTASKGTHR